MGEAEAERLLRRAEKLLEVSLLALRMKPDYDQAGPLLEQAARGFQRSGRPARAADAFKRASAVQERLGSGWHAAKHLEAAAQCTIEARGDAREVRDLYTGAMMAYAEAGRAQAGAECLARGARAVAPLEGGRALSRALLEDAVGLFEDQADGGSALGAVQGDETFREAVQWHLESEDWEAAAGMLVRWGAFSAASKQPRAMGKAYLGAVAVFLYAGRGRDAMATLGDCGMVEGFAGRGAEMADGLMDAVRLGDQKELEQFLQQSGILREVDNNVARLLKKLAKRPGLDALAEQLGGGVRNLVLDEDDLT